MDLFIRKSFGILDMLVLANLDIRLHLISISSEFWSSLNVFIKTARKGLDCK